jgi:carbon monoxide dehydrogenase subunit G
VSIRVATAVRIGRDADDVFTFIATPENLAHWDPAIRDVQRLDDGPLRQGSRLVVTAEEAGQRVRLETHVTEFEPGRLLGVAGTFRGIPLRLRWRLRPDGSGTELTTEAEADVGGFMALAGGMIRGMVEERLEAAQASVKESLEVPSAEAPSP